MKGTRLDFIDVTRGLAIILATLAHIFTHFYIWEYIKIDNNYLFLSLKIFTSFATPTLILLFGMMIEIVYMKLVVKIGYWGVLKKTIQRIVIIYFAYFLSTITYLIHTPENQEILLKQLIFLEPVTNTSILAFYIFALVVTIPIVFLRKRFGILPIFIFSIVIFVLQEFVKVRIIPLDYRYLTSLTLGIGDKIGPSTLSAILIISIGMYYANIFRENTVNKTKEIFKVLSITLISLFFITKHSSIATTIKEYASYIYRWRNDIEYYLFGIVFSSSTLYVFYILENIFKYIKQTKIYRVLTSIFRYIGSHALLAYTLGNLILNIIPRDLQASSYINSILITIFILVLQLTITYIIVEMKRYISLKYFR